MTDLDLLNALPEFRKVSVTYETLVDGSPIPFKVEDVQYYIRQPSPVERDSAELEYEKALVRMRIDPDIQALQKLPAPEDERAAYAELAEQMKALVTGETDDRRRMYWERRVNRMYAQAESRTAADSMLDKHPARVRDRWLAAKLIQDENNCAVDYEGLSAVVQEAALRIVGEMLLRIRTIPFFVLSDG